jgi:hypothetical protein
MMEEALQSARAIEDPQALIPCMAILLACSDMGGATARATTLAREFCELAPANPTFVAGFFVYVAPTMRRQEMASELGDLIKTAKPVGPGPTADVELAEAALAEMNGRLDDAFRRLSSAVSDFDGISNRFAATMARNEAARVAGLLGKEGEQIALIEGAKAQAQAMGSRRLLDQIASLSADGKRAATGGT